MAVSDTTGSGTQETEKSTKETNKSKDKKERPLTKVIVRRLPPHMDQESFITQVSPLPDYDYMYTVKGDASLGENSFSRVYINFSNVEDIYLFKEKFDNYVFVDGKGHEYPAVVEFASFQKIPRKRKPRPDPKCGSIESDPSYLEFLESLKEQPNQDEKPEFSYNFSDNKDENMTTPLLDYIKQKRIDKQRIREERREERRRKELERKRLREDERRRHEHKSPGKAITKPGGSSKSVKGPTSSTTALDSVKEEKAEKAEAAKNKSDDEKDDSLSEKNVSSAHKEHNVQNKYDDKKHFSKSKPRYMSRSERLEFSDRRHEYKRRDDYREKEFRNRRFDDYKKEAETKETPRKAKKYSEKREERRNEARKAEQRKLENLEKSKNKPDDANEEKEIKSKEDPPSEPAQNEENEMKTNSEENDEIKAEPDSAAGEDKTDDADIEEKLEETYSTNEELQDAKGDCKTNNKLKERDPRVQRRIRNKDRPTMALYQPGMLSKRKTVDNADPDSATESKGG